MVETLTGPFFSPRREHPRHRAPSQSPERPARPTAPRQQRASTPIRPHPHETLGPAPESVTPKHGSPPSKRPQLPEHRRQRSPIGLVHPIAERPRQQLQRPGSQQIDEQRGPLQRVHGVSPRDLGPQRLPRLGSAERVRRHHEHEREPRGGAIRRASGGSPPSAIVNPPRIAAATLSGCPSISIASGSKRVHGDRPHRERQPRRRAPPRSPRSSSRSRTATAPGS